MNGVTGRMGLNQHLRRSIHAIIEQGGVTAPDGEIIVPQPLLIGPQQGEAGGHLAGVRRIAVHAPTWMRRWQTRLTRFTLMRRRPTGASEAVKKAIRSRENMSTARSRPRRRCEDACELYRAADRAGVKHGAVQDKLWLPGLLKLKTLRDLGFFGDIFAVRGEFGYWVFEGDLVPSQRPSWNYRKEAGGGIIIDMLCHWRYVLDNLFGEVKAVTCLGATHIPKRWDEAGQEYKADAEDAVYATFQLENGVVAHFNSSWCVRVRRDDLLTIHVDGTKGSAVAGLRHCWIQPYGATPRPVWNPDIESPFNYFDHWQKVPDQMPFENAFKKQWELFLLHVVKGAPFRWNLREAAKGVQLAEKGIESWQRRAWVDIPALPD